MKSKTKIKDIYVSEISFDVVEEDLRKLFSVCGTVRAINMMTDKRSGLFSGRAYVRMSSEAETKEAINMLDGTLLLNRCIRVEASRDKPTTVPVEIAVEEKKSRRRRQPKGRRKIP